MQYLIFVAMVKFPMLTWVQQVEICSRGVEESKTPLT